MRITFKHAAKQAVIALAMGAACLNVIRMSVSWCDGVR